MSGKNKYPVAPDMGDFESGIALFKSPNPPYARGGGDPASFELSNACLEHLWGWDVKSTQLAPSVTLAASGQAANHLVFKALSGCDIVSSEHLFGTTKVDLKQTLARSGAQIAWADPTDTDAFIKSTTPTTRAWFMEAISNPAGKVPDFKALRAAATDMGVLLIVDGTLAVGMPGFKGKDYADILTVSLTKQAGGGRNENTGGVVITGNNFPWHDRAKDFPEITERLADDNGKVVLPPNPFGTTVSKISLAEGSGVLTPRVAMSIARDLPGMAGRVARQSKNARFLADVLSNHPAIESVQLAGYKTTASNDARTLEYMGGNHFVLLATLSGGGGAAERFVNSRRFIQAVALGQKVTAISHPAYSTHRSYSAKKLADMGIHEGTIRISVGTEPVRSLHEKMNKALTATFG